MKTNTPSSNVLHGSDNVLFPESREDTLTLASVDIEPESEREIRPWDTGSTWGFSRLYMEMAG